jgi:20S proteasome alpha/beta subunit
MTYIAAFHCREGIVMCADSQQTEGDYKNYVEKLAVVEDHSYPLAIGGAGVGDLIDCVMDEIIERSKTERPKTKQELKRLINDSLKNVYAEDLPALVVTRQHRSPQYLIGAKTDEGFVIFYVQGKRVLGETEKAIVGYGTKYNVELLKRLYRPSLPMQQAVMLGIYLTLQSKKTDDGVGGETGVVVIRDNGAWKECTEYVANAEKRVQDFTRLTDDLFLSAIDSSIPPSRFPTTLEQFKENVAQLREKYLRETAELALRLTLTDRVFRGFPYPWLFAGARIAVGFGPVTVTEETAEDRRLRQEAFQIAQRGYNQLEKAKFSKLIDGRPPLYTGTEKVQVRGAAGPIPDSDNS